LYQWSLRGISMQPFPDFGFKLVIINKLLEKGVGSFLGELDKLKADPSISCRLRGGESESYEIILEMEDFFRNVELTSADLDLVSEITFDGGNEIYELISPFWSGEDNYFDTLSVDGFENLRNLRAVCNISMVSNAEIDRFRAAGIEVMYED
jgi:hypothetical protein